MDSSQEIERLLAHREWLGSLARSLVGDRDLADELAQETWLSAIRSKVVPRFTRGWLATVFRHHHQKFARANRFRAEREERAASGEALPSVVDALAELSIQETLARELHALEEPLRTTLVLKFVEGLSRKEIARETGVAVATVGNRLERGLRRMRERLDRIDSGGRESWMSAFIALGLPRSTAAFRPEGLVLSGMGTMTKIALTVSISVVLLGVAGWIDWRASPVRIEPAEQSELVRESEATTRATLESVSRQSRAALEASEDSRAIPNASLPPKDSRQVVCRVVDTDARPLAGVGVQFISSVGVRSETMQTGADGTVAMDLPNKLGELKVSDPDWMTVGSCFLPLAARASENVVIAGRKHSVSGVVVEENALLISGAEVRFAYPPGFRSRFTHFLDRTTLDRPRVITDDRGRFELATAFVAGSALIAEHAAFMPTERALESLGVENAQIVLRRLGSHSESLSGRVVDPFGHPVADARVSFGAEVVRTDEAGMFELPREARLRGYDRLVERLGGDSCLIQAVAPGFLPARRRVERDAVGRPDWPDGLTLRLGEGAFALAGRVADETGVPVAGALVWIDGLQLFSMNAGGESVEAGLGGRIGDRVLTWKTNPKGEFEITGLLDREYVIGVLGTDNKVIAKTPPINPSVTPTIEIEIDSEDSWPLLRGRVISREGLGVSSANVFLFFDVNEMRSDDQFIRSSSMIMRSVPTDQTGKFELPNVPRAYVYLAVQGDDIEYTHFPIDSKLSERTALQLEIVVTHRVHVRVALPPGLGATEVSFLDEEGQELPLSIYRGKPGAPSTRMSFSGEFTDVLSVAETAKVLVYLDGEREVDRRRVALQRSIRNEL